MDGNLWTMLSVIMRKFETTGSGNENVTVKKKLQK